jgi:hypothetical protein
MRETRPQQAARTPEVAMKTNGHTNGQTQPPSAAVGNGGDHSPRGRFQAGNKVGMTSRFKAGNRASVGHVNAFQRQLGRIRLALATALSDADVRAIVAALVQMVVEDHSLEAVKFLCDYLVGPPLAHNTDPDSLDNAELQKLRLEGQVDALGNDNLSPPAALALEKARRLAASAGTLGEELADQVGGLGPTLLAELRRAGLDELLRATRQYADQRSERADP